MMIYRRADWPPGSNAALLARQIRTATGFTSPGRKQVMRVPEGFGKSVAPPQPLPPDELGAKAAALLAVLHAVADNGAMMPDASDLAEAIGYSRLSVRLVTVLMLELEASGEIRRYGTAKRRFLVLVARGVVISNVEAPQPVPVISNAMEAA